MMVLGGDPQSAYLLGVSGFGFLLVMALFRERSDPPAASRLGGMTVEEITADITPRDFRRKPVVRAWAIRWRPGSGGRAVL